ncbi:MAG: GNAT family N-acetyltransferase [Acidimicrobiales bacterium]
MRIRTAEVGDAAAIAEIYNLEVLESTATFDMVPRSVEEQRAWLRDRSGAHAVLVAETVEHGIVGFAALSPFRSRPAYSTTVENSVYVHRDHRKRGIALALMIELVATARAKGFHSIIARIAEAQAASIALHTAVGFELVGIEREIGRKFNRWLDVAVMQLML